MTIHPVLPLLCAVALIAPKGVDAQSLPTSAGEMQITPLVTGLEEPWGVDFLPGSALKNGSASINSSAPDDPVILITERAGRLLRVEDGQITVVSGTPQVLDDGQGGLLDVMVPRDFATTRELWLTFARPDGDGAATAVGKGTLSADGSALIDFTTLYHGDPMPGGRHFGSRLVEAADGTIFVTTGDRGTGPDGLQAQDPTRVEGKVIHLNRDGSPATSHSGWRPGLYSQGHRNIQGAALDLSGNLLTVEHGAQGGDELNRPEPARNYGWPVISYGENYGGGKIGTGSSATGMEQPLHYWVPSIAPSGLMVYSGALIPDWRADIFTGSLNSDFLSRLDPDAGAASGYAEERLAAPETGRVRDVIEGPDGAIWFLSVFDGALYRLAPQGK